MHFRNQHSTLTFLTAFLTMLAIVLIFPACQAPEQGPDLSKYPTGLEAKEAPMLAYLVEQGELPPLEERLPENPLVAKHDYDGYEGPGVYGGTWQTFHADTWMANWFMIAGYVPLIRWRFDCQGVEPGLAESWEFNDDGTQLTLHLRKGLRWSDGAPCTSEDFAFWYENATDKKFGSMPPTWCLVPDKNGVKQQMAVETPDPYTIILKFAGPAWLTPYFMANETLASSYMVPKHYMKQFHPRYNPQYKDNIEYHRKGSWLQNLECPHLWPWIPYKSEKGGFRVEFRRNPYYFVVDDLGRQLPYIDRMKSNYVSDPQVRILQMLSGDIDCEFRGLELRDMEIFKTGEKQGNYKIRMWETGVGAEPALIMNWTPLLSEGVQDPVTKKWHYPIDEVMCKLFRDQRFRKALALGIDRDKINRVVFHGYCVVQGATTSREAWHFADEEGQALFREWEQTDCEFNLEKGNALLDDMGLTKRDPRDGVRLRPDGERLEILIDMRGDTPFYADASIIIKEGWQQLGIEPIIFTPQFTELDLRQRQGTFLISTNGMAEMDICTYPSWVFPVTDEYFHPLEGRYYMTKGQEGIAPTGPMKELTDIYKKIVVEEDLNKRHQLVRDAIRVHIDDGPFNLGVVGRPPCPVLVSDRFHNVPTTGVLGAWAVVQPATSYPEQYYIQEVKEEAP